MLILILSLAYFFSCFWKIPLPCTVKGGFFFPSTRLLAQSLLGACGGLQSVVIPHSKIILILLATPLMMRTVLAQEFSCPTLPVLLLFRLSLSVHMGQLQGLGSGAVKCTEAQPSCGFQVRNLFVLSEIHPGWFGRNKQVNRALSCQTSLNSL